MQYRLCWRVPSTPARMQENPMKTEKTGRWRLLKSLSGVGVFILALLLAGWYFYVKDYAPYFVERKGRLVGTKIVSGRIDSVLSRSWLTLTSSSGMRVECGMLKPRTISGRLPAIVLLGGKATGKYAIDYVPDIAGVIVVAVDYPYEPRRSYTVTGFLADVPEMRHALLDMVPSVMLVIDYLDGQPDVDSSRIVVLGYSFGAPFVPCILAHDRRPAMAAMVFGGGEMFSLIEHNVRRYENSAVSKFVGLIGGFLLRPLEPLRYAEKISPIPFIMVNGTADEMIPRRNAELVYERAKEPKKLIWLESGHVRPDKVELTKQILRTLQRELRRLKILE